MRVIAMDSKVTYAMLSWPGCQEILGTNHKIGCVCVLCCVCVCCVCVYVYVCVCVCVCERER